LKLLKVLRDEDLIESARDAANELIDSDPELKKAPELAALIVELLKEERASYVDKG
jgi:ATP-dependent DNA helicase RecG